MCADKIWKDIHLVGYMVWGVKTHQGGGNDEEGEGMLSKKVCT